MKLIEIYYNMYKIFDLHNDYFLKLGTDKKKNKYVESDSKSAENIVSAVWTSDLSNEESLMVIKQAFITTIGHADTKAE